jgi:hypothetical protein
MKRPDPMFLLILPVAGLAAGITKADVSTNLGASCGRKGQWQRC